MWSLVQGIGLLYFTYWKVVGAVGLLLCGYGYLQVVGKRKYRMLRVLIAFVAGVCLFLLLR